MAQGLANWVSWPVQWISGAWRRALSSLQIKASLLVVTLVLLVTGFGTALGLHGMSAVLYENEAVRTQEWACSLVPNAARALCDGDRNGLRQMAASLVHMRGVAYVVFADSQRRIQASSQIRPGLLEAFLERDGATMICHSMRRPDFVHFGEQDLSCIDVIVPIYDLHPGTHTGTPGRFLGFMRFAADVSGTQAKLGEVAMKLSRTAITIALLLIPCSLLVTRHVVAPVRELARTAHAIADGSMDARAPVSSRDEIGELAKSFNRMANRVAESQLELLRLNSELEQRVQQRTQELQELAARDPLTALYNRRYFGEVLTREFAAAERYEDDLTLLMFDLDHFKMMNDRYGHRAGDDILIALAHAIAGELRGSDVAARFGGDEFILLLPQTSSAAAMSLADRVVRTFTREVDEARPGLLPTVSIGVASLRTTRAPSSEALVHEADIALYAAKEAGRNRTVEATALATA